MPSQTPATSYTLSSPDTVDSKMPQLDEMESGYASASSSASSSASGLPQVNLTQAHVRHLNKQLEKLSAIDRLRFVKAFFPSLYQTTAFGLTGLVTIDMLSKIQTEDPESSPVDLIFLDTLYHFKETYELVDRVKTKYSNITVHIFRPDGADTEAEFDEKYGAKLYETSDELYDWIAKVEPQQRSYSDLNVAAVLTGRRRSQGGQRDKIQILEVDESGIIKINPLVDWSFKQVKSYIDDNNVPYNALLDQGYKSIGDWHSTSPVKEGEDERAGRWKGQQKSECGIHNKKSRYAQHLEEMERKERQEQQLEEKRQLATLLEKAGREQHTVPASIVAV